MKYTNRRITPAMRGENGFEGVAAPVSMRNEAGEFLPLSVEKGAEIREVRDKIGNLVEDLLNGSETMRNAALERFRNDSTGSNITAQEAAQVLGVIDIELGAAETAQDISGQIAVEFSPPRNGWTKTVKIKELLDPAAPFGRVQGDNDRVPLMEHKAPAADDMEIEWAGVGDKESLNKMFDNLYDYQRSVRAAQRGYVNYRNAEVLTPLLGASYGSANSQAALSSGATWDINVYNEIRQAIFKLDGLTYALTKENVGQLAGEYVLVCNGTMAKQIAPIVGGQVNSASIPQLTASLGVSVVGFYGSPPYIYGKSAGKPLTIPNTDAYLIKKTAQDKPGFARGTAAELLFKQGESSALEGSVKEFAWFRASGVFSKYALPSDNSGNGLVIKLALPALA
ncbi:MAG: hypothetical protein LBL45_10215 [Treponema sp.]|nr:hypothetical protein [Treponema sp.]